MSKLLQASKEAADRETIEREANILLQFKTKLAATIGEEWLSEFDFLNGGIANIKGTDWQILCNPMNTSLFIRHRDLKTYPTAYSCSSVEKLGDIWKTIETLERELK